MKFHQTLSEAEYEAASLYLMKRQAREPQWLALIVALLVMIPTIAWFVFANDERYWFAMFMIFFVVLLLVVDTHFIPTRFQAKAANNSRHGQPARRNYLPLFICTLIQQLRIQKEEPLPYTV